MARVAAMAAAARPRTQLGVVCGGDGEERSRCRGLAEDGGQHEQHAHAELDQGLILVADLRWKEARRELGIGAGLEGAQAPAGQRPLTGAAAVPRGNSVRRNRARKPCQLNSTFARHGGGAEPGDVGAVQRPRRGCGRSRWPAPQMRGHFSTELRCRYTCQLNSGETPKKNLCTRDGRGERWGQRTRGMRGCSCAERACA